MSDYTLERISAELDAIFGREPARSGLFQAEGTVSPPSTTTIAFGPTPNFGPTPKLNETQVSTLKSSVLGPAPSLPLFTDNPTAREVCSQHTRIFAALGQEDEFLAGMIQYHQRKLREANKEEIRRQKQKKRR